jgi:hypothetical protein
VNTRPFRRGGRGYFSFCVCTRFVSIWGFFGVFVSDCIHVPNHPRESIANEHQHASKCRTGAEHLPALSKHPHGPGGSIGLRQGRRPEYGELRLVGSTLPPVAGTKTQREVLSTNNPELNEAGRANLDTIVAGLHDHIVGVPLSP